ncbi:PP2C family protein-serine/threonine phosphatase [Eubacterium xylanophilum]|uniref:PP2C family protein-serine/threonine phosphatase n=1 Tax=Eubacterium xylanophilum TaxID=39497 RepID=UPI0004BA70F8|nr:PP2C family protein-serine/threonine phosphatase [Eubacterium xylanophilum]
MVNIYKKYSLKIGLVFTIVSALMTTFVLSALFSGDPRMNEFLYDCGIDMLGGLICAALYFGCMKQSGEGGKVFRSLIVLVSFVFFINELMYCVYRVPEKIGLCMFCVLCSKIADIVMIYLFYTYVKKTLGLDGKMRLWADRGFPILSVFEIIILLSNIIYPTTFSITSEGVYQAAAMSWLEDIYLIVALTITAILIIRCGSPRNQKLAALTFIFLPIIEFVILGGQFGSAGQYGTVLMSLVIMYCVIFNYNSSKLSATQAELDMATEIQASMLPSIFPAFPARDEFDLYASMDPAKEVGGDFYDFFMIDDNHLGVVIADVSGKGIPAALFMMISKTVVQNYAMLGIKASEVLRRANEALCVQNKMEMFVTTWVGILELSTGKMNCSSAGHEYPAICHDGKFDLLKDKHGFVLGAMDIAKYSDYEIQLEKGDRIFVYTDGVPEATSEDKELYGTDRMIEALNTCADGTPKDILNTVRESVDSFVGNAEQFDDLTMVCLEYRG